MVPALAAVAGVVAAHAIDYAVLFPRSGARADHLAATGHSYWPAAAAVAVAAGLVALALTIGRGALRGVRGRGRPFAVERDPAWLLLCQGTAFAVLEAGERALVGLPPSIVLHSPEFWLGLVLQLPVAWLAMRLLAAIEGAACRLAAARRTQPPRPVRVLPVPASTAALTAAAAASPARPRAPPLAA